MINTDFILRFLALPEWYERRSLEKFMAQCKGQVEIHSSDLDVKGKQVFVHFKFDMHDNKEANMFNLLKELNDGGFEVILRPLSNKSIRIDLVYSCIADKWIERAQFDESQVRLLMTQDAEAELVGEVETDNVLA